MKKSSSSPDPSSNTLALFESLFPAFLNEKRQGRPCVLRFLSSVFRLSQQVKGKRRYLSSGMTIRADGSVWMTMRSSLGAQVRRRRFHVRGDIVGGGKGTDIARR